MIVQENLKILADDKHVKQLFVDGLKLRDRTILPGIVNLERQVGRLPGLDRTAA